MFRAKIGLLMNRPLKKWSWCQISIISRLSQYSSINFKALNYEYEEQ